MSLLITATQPSVVHPVPPEAGIDSARILSALLRQNLSAFTERCFYKISGGQAYHHNWHLDALAWHLGEVAEGGIKRLPITLPPRSLKSISIAFPAWLLGLSSERRIICTSYVIDLAVDLANSFRSALKAKRLRDLFPKNAH